MDFNFDLLDNQLDNIEGEEQVVLSSVEQWHKDRLGKLTASRYDDMMTNDRSGKGLGQAAMKYIYEKVAELLTNAPHAFTSQATEWGITTEAEAIAKYEELTGNTVVKCDFISHGQFAGSTPDGLVDNDGMLEVKCPFNPANHAETLILGEVPDKHIYQIQGNLMTTGRQWCDFVSYDPRVEDQNLKIFIKRIYRDEEIIKAIQERIELVSKMIQDLYQKLKT